MTRLLSAFLCVLCLELAPARADSSLSLTAKPGTMIHDATYLPPPFWWPPGAPWNGEGQNEDASYRYGPSLIRYDGNKLHFWACSEGDSEVADYIRYKHSDDGGASWGQEAIALAPTVGSDDGWAVCDPNVIKIGIYFYLAYTATTDSSNGGLDNQIFVARATAPDGPYSKWNGTGWGGNPKPIVTYNGPPTSWGYGEPNMVVVGDTLYLYYTDGEATGRTRVATANANSTDWPATLVQRGYAIADRDSYEDQTDVKYLPEVNLFIATAIGERFTMWSYVHVWWSSDGLSFQPVDNDEVTENVIPKAHNMGMSGDYLGHARMGGQEYISYSYTGPGGSWGRWNTWLNPVTISGAGWSAVPPAQEEPMISIMPILMLLLDE
ncbi:MAG: hypothetical protein HKN85_00385 [Gammaproteobacteria bacterium]|nr:hypothetical protein [Gammaproteobacteria bacterium]